ncbi:type VI secretion protein VgrG [Candidatus Magnetomorum sp. HK-1]|nr:type VI secretion protein VgrG [Candidatus Magnetomorum sp. HK-1]
MAEPKFTFKTNSGDFSVLFFEGQEKISQPYHYQIRLVSTDVEIDIESLAKKRACLTIQNPKGQQRQINGVIVQIGLEEISVNHALYQIELYPMIQLLAYRRQSRIFQQKTVPDIIKQVITDAGLSSSDISIQLSGSYPQRVFCMQYDETDLKFIERLMAEEGIFYFFQQKPDKEVLVLGDSISAYLDCQPQKTIPYHSQSGSLYTDDEYLDQCSIRFGVHTGKVIVNDYFSEKPDVQLRVPNAADKHNELEIYEQSSGFFAPDHGQALAKSRLEHHRLSSRILVGKGTYSSLAPGHKFEIQQHPNASVNQLYTVLEMKQKGTQTQVLVHGEAGDEGTKLESSFIAILSEQTIRPAAISKPVAMSQTATVVGPEGETYYIDNMGRVKVRFHWDRQCEDNECSCWIRVNEFYAGSDHGSQFPPLINDSVIISFIHGDPDRPIITGRVYDGNQTPPIKPDQMVRNVIQTPYGHQVVIDDKNACLSLTTAGGDQLLMTDGWKEDGNMVRLASSDGHTFSAAEGDNLKGIKLVSKAGHTVSMIDDPSPKISVVDKGEQLKIDLDCDGKSITIDNADSGAITIQCTNGKIVLSAKTVEITGQSGINMSSNSHIAMSAGTIQIKGSQKVEIEGGMELNAKAGTTFKAESGATMSIEGGATTKVQGGALTEVKGALVKIN